MIVMPAAGARPEKDAILETLGNAIAKWQLPDDIVFIDHLPLTATGKISELTLRKQFQDHPLPERE